MQTKCSDWRSTSKFFLKKHRAAHFASFNMKFVRSYVLDHTLDTLNGKSWTIDCATIGGSQCIAEPLNFAAYRFNSSNRGKCYMEICLDDPRFAKVQFRVLSHTSKKTQ